MILMDWIEQLDKNNVKLAIVDCPMCSGTGFGNIKSTRSPDFCLGCGGIGHIKLEKDGSPIPWMGRGVRRWFKV
jgi:hypothetical protein